MARLPPVEKLSLAVRKNVRDAFDNKKDEYEKKLSDLLGTPWTIDFNPNALYAYATSAFAKDRPGTLMAAYVDGALYQLGRFATSNGSEGLAELNAIAGAHVLTMDVDEAARNPYCGCAVADGGRLAILFNAEKLGVNTNEALAPALLQRALNEAPPAEGSGGGKTLSFAARTSIRKDYEPAIEAVRASIGTMVNRPDIQLEPNFADTFAKLAAEAARGKDARVSADNFERQLGMFARDYFKGLVFQLETHKFGGDDLLQEGFNEAVDKGVVALRIVDTLTYGTYGEVVVQDGTLYIQTTVAHWGKNLSYAAEKIVDQL